MSNYILSAELTLKDKFSIGIEKAEKGSKKLGRTLDNLKREIFAFDRNFSNAGSVVKRAAKDLGIGAGEIERAVSKVGISTLKLGSIVAKLGAAGVSGVAGAGAYAIKSAADMERYRSVLEAVLKDEQKAANTMSWANKFANSTPYQNEEVIEGVVRLSSAGIAKEDMSYIGDLAAAAGKPLMQAVEAIIDARTGELERLKELNVTKDDIMKHAAKIGDGDLFNTKGQITDFEAFRVVLKDLIELKFGGTMEKNADTFYGAMSTTIGTIKSAITQIAGIGLDGKTIAGSMFDYIRNKAIDFRTTIEKMQEDGSLDRLTQKVGKTFADIIPDIEHAADVLKKNWKPENVESIIKGTGSVIGELGQSVTATSNLIQNFPDKGIGAFSKFADELPPVTKRIISVVGAAALAITAFRAAAGDPIAIGKLVIGGTLGASYVASKGLSSLILGINDKYESWKHGYNVEPVVANWDTWKDDKELINKLSTGDDPIGAITGRSTADLLGNLYNYQPSTNNNSPFLPSQTNAGTFKGNVNFNSTVNINGSNLSPEETKDTVKKVLKEEVNSLYYKIMSGDELYKIY